MIDLKLIGRAVTPRGLRARYHRWLVDEFLTYFLDCGTPWMGTTWLGVPALQAANDLVVLQQIVVETRPDLVVETGTLFGGSALFFAHMLDAVGGDGRVLTIDAHHNRVAEPVRRHARIDLLQANTRHPETVAEVIRRAEGRRVMLHLDANHRAESVLGELRDYGGLVAPGCYCVVADCIMGGHPAPYRPDGEPARDFAGPYEAVDQFLAETDDFERDRSREYQMITFNRGGFLRRRD